MPQLVDNHGERVPRCDLWLPLNPGELEWKWCRCDRPFGHRNLCFLRRGTRTAKGVGVTKAVWGGA